MNPHSTEAAIGQGWEERRSAQSTSYHKGGEKIWRASARRQWVRAKFDGTKVSHHRSFDTFGDALADKDGEKFGPTWRQQEPPIEPAFKAGEWVRLREGADPTEVCSPTRAQMKALETGVRIEDVGTDCGDGITELYFSEEVFPFVVFEEWFEHCDPPINICQECYQTHEDCACTEDDGTPIR